MKKRVDPVRLARGLAIMFRKKVKEFETDSSTQHYAYSQGAIRAYKHAAKVCDGVADKMEDEEEETECQLL